MALFGEGHPALTIAAVWFTTGIIVAAETDEEEEEDEDEDEEDGCGESPRVLVVTCIFPSPALNEAITMWSTSASRVPLLPSCLYLTSPTSCPIVATNAGNGSVFAAAFTAA